MALPDGYPDGSVLAEEDLGLRRWGVDRMNLAVWDASAGVRRDASADACRELPRLGAASEKSVVRALAYLEPDAPTLDVSAGPVAALWFLAELLLASVEPGKPDAVLSAAQSCVEQAFAAERALALQVVEPALHC